MAEFPVICKRLKESRLRAGLSQEGLGVLAGIDEFSASARMNQYERGRHTPNYSLIVRLAGVLKVPTAYFYTEDDQLAECLLLYARMSSRSRASLLEFARELSER